VRHLSRADFGLGAQLGMSRQAAVVLLAHRASRIPQAGAEVLLRSMAANASWELAAVHLD